MSNEKRDVGYSKETFLVHGKAHDLHWEFDHHVIPPITASTTFKMGDSQRGYDGFMKFGTPGNTDDPIYLYDRLGEPTVSLLEHRFREIEGGDSATAFACGMAAISSTILALCKAGEHILAHRTIYGCTYSLMVNWLPRYGISTDFVDMTSLGGIKDQIGKNTRIVYLESPSNPILDIIDISGLKEIIEEANKGRAPEDRIRMVVDNTFATPFCQQPLSHGADIVVHSLTKNVMGFGTDMGGIVVCSNELYNVIRMARKDFGGVLAPRAAWNILVYGISTLHVRMHKQIENSLVVAKFLEEQPEIERVMYPGLKSHPQFELAKKQMRNFDDEFAPGHMVYFELAGKQEELLDKLRLFIDHIAKNAYTITLAVSLGNTKTLIESPALSTHTSYADKIEDAGISYGGVRLSLGIENVKDIIADLRKGLDAINGV